MMNNPEALARMSRSNGTAHAHLALQLFLALTANVQFPGQDPRPREKAGRLIALLEELPRRFPDRIPRDQARQAGELLPKTVEFLGAPASTLALCFLVVMNWLGISYFRSKYALTTVLGNPLHVQDARERRLRILNALFEPEALLDQFVVFTTAQLARVLVESPAREAFSRQFSHFLRLFSASAGELRQAAANLPEFQLGHLSSRLSPLERFPLVRIERAEVEQGLIIPNVAHFLKSFSPVIDYSLLSRFGNTYSQVRGALLEVYLRSLIEERLPHLIVIPETTYSQEERRGPDLTIIDQALRRLILIEIKGRRIKLSTRLTMIEEELRENLTDAHDALLRLPRKLDELYAGLPEYSAYQDALDETRGSVPVFVAVLSEGVYSMGELARELGEHQGDPLYGYPYPYCILALEIFERAVETARITTQPLARLLYEHWERSLRREYQGLGADSFGGRHPPEEEMYAASFAPWFG